MEASLQNRSGFNVVEVREIFFEISVAFLLDTALGRSTASRETFAVLPVDFIHDVHAFGDFAERGETHVIELGVVPEVNEQLGCSCVGTGGCESDSTPCVAGLNGVIGNI